jgi:predicted phosphodiesterase
MKRGKTVVVSDIHIGNGRESHIVKFVECLEKLEFDTIIFNGDIFDFFVYRKGNKDNNKMKEHWPYVMRIRELIRGKKVYYLPGNHDKWCLLLIPFGFLFGMKIRKRIHHKGYIVEHGDFIEFYLQVRRIFNKNIVIHKGGEGEDDFHNNCIELAKIKGKPFIVGHSHVPLIVEGLLYDEGDWVEHKDETHDNYLVIDRYKEPKLFFYNGEYILKCKRN